MAIVQFKELLGKTLKSIEISEQEDYAVFETEEGEQYKMYHDQDCCESVSIEDIVGDLKYLLLSPVTMAGESTDTENPKKEIYGQGEDAWESVDESSTWTFYKLATVKGYVTIRWYGSSNGYYSESVSFVKGVNGDFNLYDWN